MATREELKQKIQMVELLVAELKVELGCGDSTCHTCNCGVSMGDSEDLYIPCLNKAFETGWKMAKSEPNFDF